MLKNSSNLLRGEIDPVFAKRAEFIFKSIEKHKPRKVLDIGCGRGFYINAISKYEFVEEISGIDVNPNYLRIAKANANSKTHLSRASVYKLPFKDSSFDAVICSEVLEHLKDDKKGMFEVARVLKKNGMLVITVPHNNYPFLWDPVNWLLTKIFDKHVNKNFWFIAGIWADHERLYGKKELRKLVESSGFKQIKLIEMVSSCWPFSHFILYGIGKNIVERMPVGGFNRFDENKSFLAKLLSWVFYLPTVVKRTGPSVNLGLRAYKD